MLAVLNKRYPGCEPEYYFHPTRKWRFDYAWPELKIGLEIEGGTWGKKKSRHSTGKGYRDDCIKYSEAAVLGWRIIRCTTDMCQNGFMYDLLDRAMK